MLAMAVTMGAAITPAAAAIAAGAATSGLLPTPIGVGWALRWWFLVVAVPLAVFVVTDRTARRALPLAALLRMALVFPDRAPHRLAVARRSAPTRHLQPSAGKVVAEATDRRTGAAGQIVGLVARLNAHDRRTRGHSERVRLYTDLLAEELRLPAADRDRLRWAALLHDIGKLGVPASLLNKAGRPDPTEWAAIRRHPIQGSVLAAPLADWLGDWYGAIEDHHEKWDGTGYPRGKRGADISYAGRIVAVADSYEAMTAARSYSRPMSHQAALRVLAMDAGTHFDPDVVRAFIGAPVRRLRAVGGPLALLGQIPFLSSVPGLTQLATATTSAAAGLTTAAAVAVTATTHLAVPPPAQAPKAAAVATVASPSGPAHPPAPALTVPTVAVPQQAAPAAQPAAPVSQGGALAGSTHGSHGSAQASPGGMGGAPAGGGSGAAHPTPGTAARSGLVHSTATTAAAPAVAKPAASTSGVLRAPPTAAAAVPGAATGSPAAGNGRP